METKKKQMIVYKITANELIGIILSFMIGGFFLGISTFAFFKIYPVFIIAIGIIAFIALIIGNGSILGTICLEGRWRKVEKNSPHKFWFIE
jgi:hypothetical protein